MIDETGTLLREEGGFVLRRDVGGRCMLDMHRVGLEHGETRIRVSGVMVANGLVDVVAIGRAD